CSHGYEVQDLAYCTFYHKPIGSLCCSLEPHCRDYCKRATPAAGGRVAGAPRPGRILPLNVPPRIGRRIWQVLAVFLTLMSGLALGYAGLRLLLATGRETSLLPQLLF